MTMGIMEASYGLVPAGIIGAFLLMTSAIGLGVVSKLIEKRTKTNIYRWLLLVGFLTFISIIAFIIVGNVQYFITDYRAEKIIHTLEQYQTDKGEYPANLETLKEGYMERIPSTAYGVLRQDFKYTRNSTDKFGIHYYSYIGVEYWYDSETKEWRVDD